MTRFLRCNSRRPGGYLGVIRFFKLLQGTFDLRICAALTTQFGLYLLPVFALHISALAVSFASRLCCPDLEPAPRLLYKMEDLAHMPIVQRLLKVRGALANR